MKNAMKVAVLDGLVSALVLTGFSVAHHRVVGEIKAVNAKAQANLAAAPAVSLRFRLDDPDHSFQHLAVTAADGPATPGEAKLMVGLSLTVVATQVIPGETTPRVELLLRNGKDVLVDVRAVEGVVYARTGWAALRRTFDLAEPGSSRELEQEARSVARQSRELGDAVHDLRAGKWLALDLFGPAGLPLANLGGGGFLPDGAGGPLPDLGRALQRAVTPHVEVRDLVTAGTHQTIHVDVAVKDAIQGAMKAISKDSQLTVLLGAEPVGKDDLSDLSDATVHSTLSFDRGHYSQLRVPLGDLFALDAHPARTDPKPKDFGRSALVLDVNDRVSPVEAPPASQVSDVDLAGLLQQAFQQLAGGMFGGGFGA